MTEKERFQTKLAVLAAVAAVSTSALFVRASNAPPVAIAANRLLLSLLFLAPLAFYTSSGEIRAAKPKDRALAALAGAFLALHFLLWFSSLNMTSVAASVVLVSTHPLFILAYSRFFYGETVGAKALGGTLLSLAGIVLIAFADWRLAEHGLSGDFLALGGAVAVSGYFLLGRHLRKTMGNLNYVTHTYTVAFLILAAYAWVSQTPLFSYPAREWVIFGALALFPTILGHTVFNWALARIEVSFVSVMILAEPVIATVLALIIFGEVPHLLHIGGAALVLSGLGVYLVSAGRS
ncbi:MAG: EamA family transporter [Bacillota bacterium]|nr:EamA family transporter [Bacillota bacterium]MDW7683963.1 EamA family transporter [Bacillota bacterium]